MGCGASSSVPVEPNKSAPPLNEEESFPETSLKSKRALATVIAPVKVDDNDDDASGMSSTSYCSVDGPKIVTPAPEFTALKTLARTNPEAKKLLQGVEEFEKASAQYMQSLNDSDEYLTYGKAGILRRQLEKDMLKTETKAEKLKHEGKFRLAEKALDDLLTARVKFIEFAQREEEERALFVKASVLLKNMSFNYELCNTEQDGKSLWKDVVSTFETWPRYVDLSDGAAVFQSTSRQQSSVTTINNR